VGCEPDFGSGQERRRGGSLLIRQRLCVGESGEAVDGRVQVGVTAFRASRFRSTDSLGLVAVAAMDAPAAAVGYSADLLHVQVHHMTGPARDDLPGIAIVVSTGIDEPASAQAEPGQVPSDSAAVNPEPTVGKLVADALSRPLMLTPPGFDLLNDPRSEEHTSELQSRFDLVCRL